MNRVTTKGAFLALLALAAACAETSETAEYNAGLACVSQPNMRFEQRCYTEQEPRLVAVAAAQFYRARQAGEDTAAIAQEASALQRALQRCGEPPSSSRVTETTVGVWRCRERYYAAQVVRRTPPLPDSTVARP